MSRSIFDYRQRMIRVNDATYVLTPIDKLFTNDIFYIKKRGVYTQDVKGPYTFKEGMTETKGQLLMKRNIKTKCGERFTYSHFRHGAGDYPFEFYKYVQDEVVKNEDVKNEDDT